MFLLKCFWNRVFLPFWGDRKGRQKGFRSRGSCFSLSHQSSKKTSKGDHFGTLVEGICRLKSFMGRYRNSRTKTCDMRAPPPGSDSSGDVRPRRPDGTIWRGKLKAGSKKHTISDHTLGSRAVHLTFQAKTTWKPIFLKGGLYICIHKLFLFPCSKDEFDPAPGMMHSLNGAACTTSDMDSFSRPLSCPPGARRTKCAGLHGYFD